MNCIDIYINMNRVKLKSLIRLIMTESNNYPTGDWRGWLDFTSEDKERLKIVLNDWIRYIQRLYVYDIISTKIFLIKKVMDNLEVSDPRYAASPLAQFSLEDRLALMDYVDKVDKSGTSGKLMDFLMALSRNKIKSPTPPKPDIHLKDITDVVWPGGHQKGDVTIYGIQDMRPTINFGYGPYTLNDEFIEEFSKPNAQLYLDFGQEVKVTNMQEVMKKVVDALKNFK